MPWSTTCRPKRRPGPRPSRPIRRSRCRRPSGSRCFRSGWPRPSRAEIAADARPRRIQGRLQAGRFRLHQACVGRHDLDESRHFREFRRTVGAAGDRRSSGRSRGLTTCWSAFMRPASAITMCSRAAARSRAASPAACSATRSPARSSRPAQTCRRHAIGERVVIYQRLYCGQCRYCLARPAGPLPQQPRAGRERGRRLCRIHLRAGAQRDSHAGRPRHEGGGACGLSGRHQRARGAWRCAGRARADGADHRRRRRAWAASDPGGEERERARASRSPARRTRPRSSARPAPTRSSSART